MANINPNLYQVVFNQILHGMRKILGVDECQLYVKLSTREKPVMPK